MNCTTEMLFELPLAAVSPPPGSKNVRLGQIVTGPGGSWVPCATKVASGFFYPGLFQVGPGQRQVCISDYKVSCSQAALNKAIKIAHSAAA